MVNNIQVCTFHDGCKQGIDQQMFNRKSISRKITHPQSLRTVLKDRRCVILREIDFLLKICWSIPCLHPSWKVHTWIAICASLNHRKKTKADGSRLIPLKHTETLVLLSVVNNNETVTLIKFVTYSLLVSPVEWSYLNTDMRKVESSQKDESRAQSTDSSEDCRKPSGT